jgi:hypothetical protein
MIAGLVGSTPNISFTFSVFTKLASQKIAFDIYLAIQDASATKVASE